MLRPDVQKTRSFADGAKERISFAPMSEEENEIMSIEEYTILQYHDNYRKALKGEASWWDVYSSEKEVDAEVALQKRVEASKRTELVIKQNYQFFESIVGIPRRNCTKACEMAAFAVRFGNKPQIRIFED